MKNVVQEDQKGRKKSNIRADEKHIFTVGGRALISCCAVAKLRWRNIWINISVLRNCRREAGCAQRDTRCWARNIFHRRLKKIVALVFRRRLEDSGGGLLF